MSDSITWRWFCRILIDARVPHPTTLMKLTTRCGTTAVGGCNEALLAKAADAKLLRVSRLRADTTVVPGNVAYPTDSGLLAMAVRRIAATGRRVQAAGGATRARLTDRSRAVGWRAHGIAAKLRLRSAPDKAEAQRTVRRITGELAGLAERAVSDAQRLLTNAHRALRRAQAKAEQLAAAGRRRGRLHRAANDLTDLLDTTGRVAAQTRQRLAGIIPDGATRRISLHDGDARPIAKGRLGKPVEFGYKAQVVDNDDGIVLDHTVEQGNPPDAPQLVPAGQRVVARSRRRPRTVTADRGYGEKSVEDDLHELGVRAVVIPRKGNPARAVRPRNIDQRFGAP